MFDQFYHRSVATDLSSNERPFPWSGSSRTDLTSVKSFVKARPSLTPVVSKRVEQSTSTESLFKKHAAKWQRDTSYLSSPVDRYSHPSYARIIGLGPDVVSILLRDVRDNQNDWFYALRAITGANPVKKWMAGDVAKMSHAWVQWGRERGLVDGGAP